MLILLPLLGIFGNSLIAGVEANLSLGFKVIRLPRHINPANCSVGNTTFAHGATFKLDCKTQCVCENGRHACSTLCPNEQLPAPEDTISCRSPRLVEVPGHCCKMWLCENPTADVYATCHNSSTSGNWSACSSECGLGMATRQTSTHAGCHQLSNLRLCENRRCAEAVHQDEEEEQEDNKKQQRNNAAHNRPLANGQREHHRWQRQHNLQRWHHQLHQHKRSMQQEPAHRIRKGHECRSLQRLGPARVRLGECVSRKLYRPKLCGSCHRGSKCCAPAATTTIQVEMLCPLNAVDPINFVQRHTQQQQQQQQEQQQQEAATAGGARGAAGGGAAAARRAAAGELWDTVALEPIDQEFLQSHQIQIENKFIAVEWILKCECSKNHCSARERERKRDRAAADSGKYARNKQQQQQQQGAYLQAHNDVENELTLSQASEGAGYAAVVQPAPDSDAVRVINSGAGEDNSASEQQPDIIPYPLSVGETSWQAEKQRRQQREREERERAEEMRWSRT